MGGYGAMNLALRHPGVFAQVVSIAGYFHVDDPDGVFAGNAKTQNANAPDHHVAAAAALRILLLDGEEDQESVVKGEAQRFMDLLDDAGIPATLLLTPGNHSWQYVAGQLPAITTFLEDGFAK
jgi:S-formylglutathione hydrolase FrmB